MLGIKSFRLPVLFRNSDREVGAFAALDEGLAFMRILFERFSVYENLELGLLFKHVFV